MKKFGGHGQMKVSKWLKMISYDQDITYLDQKHKRGTWHLHTNLAHSIRSWVCVHPDDVFYFQDVGEVNGIHVPFTIGI